ncbi:MAG: outer membrane beta-barrel protein [Saprospiraceae bacterium]|nr:outer membrane beta-barrel protein [Saprospiraceae bacterium]
MKKLIVFTVFIFISQFAFSQLRLGVVGSFGASVGRSESTLLGTKEGRKAYEVAFLEHKNQPSIGIGLYNEVGNLFFMAEGHYRKNAYTLRVKNYLNIDEPMNYIEETASTVHIPIAGGVKIGSLKIGVGPIFNFQIDGSEDMLTSYEITDRSRELQMGFQGLVGIDLNKHFSVNLKYEHSFSRVGDDYRYNGKILPIESKLNYLTFSVAMFL